MSVLKMKSNGLSKWMILSSPGKAQRSLLFYRGHYPRYIIEILAFDGFDKGQSIEFRGQHYKFEVRKDIDEKGPPPISYVSEMLLWYHRSRKCPKLSTLIITEQDPLELLETELL